MHKILLVDQDSSFRKVYAGLLQAENYTVIEASHSRQALDSLAGDQFDAIITEILLPGKNGLKLIQTIRLNPEWLEIPIFILTTLEPIDTHLPASLVSALGIKAYLVKQQTSPEQVSFALKALLPAR